MSSTNSPPSPDPAAAATGATTLIALVLGSLEVMCGAIRLATAVGIALTLGGGLCLALIVAAQNLTQAVRTQRQARVAAFTHLSREAAPPRTTQHHSPWPRLLRRD